MLEQPPGSRGCTSGLRAEVRRGLRALNSVFGNKVAILAGDFLLARASVSLAALRDSEVIQLLSQVIEDLVTGEILQVLGHGCAHCAGCSVNDDCRNSAPSWTSACCMSAQAGSHSYNMAVQSFLVHAQVCGACLRR